ncbi:MAG: transporter, partial [Cellulomonadaceae bacterium]|nr:transporter [Cellulomonadaceae bacterium]
ENDIDEIEDQLFTQDPSVSQRIYELVREVIAFQRAAGPMVTMTRDLELGTVFLESPVAGAQPEPHTSDIPSAPAAASAGSSDDVEIRRQMRDVLDHAIAVSERALEFRQMLENALQVHATLVAQQQNEEMKKLSEVSVVQGEAAKKISSWAAIFLAPTLIAGIYGMNFQEMPELHWLFGYPFALALMVLAAVLLYRRFKKVDWL